MTAVGFVLLILGGLGFYASFNRDTSKPNVAEIVTAVSSFIGAALLMAGVTVWLWRVMP